MDFIFNDNLIILLVLYFLLYLIYLILNYFSSLKKYSLISFITISVWILFQHNFLKININLFLESISELSIYSSEIALVFIILAIFLFFILIKRKKIYTIFFLFFLILNLFFSISQFTKELNSQENNYNIEENKINLINDVKKPNIYYFILDAMMPLNEFKDYYKRDLTKFENFYTQKNYLYFKDTLNFYPDTTDTLTSLFFLDEIFVKKGNYDNDNLKPNIYKKFPGLLSQKYNPILISELNKLGYQFK